MKEHFDNIDKGYILKGNKLRLFIKDTGIISKSPFKVEPDEVHLIPEFVQSYNKLKKKQREYVRRYRNTNFSKAFYYCMVWHYTNTDLNNVEIPKGKVIDHIKPIIKGFRENIDPKEIGNKSNIQFITSKQNLFKSTK